jgi:hypothetical protein
MLPAFLLTGFAALAFNSNVRGQVPITGKIDRGRLYGGIEISSEGIKAAVIRVSGVERGTGAEVVYTEVVNTTLARARNGGFAPEMIQAAAQAVRRLYTRMQQEHQVPPRQIHIIGGSEFDAESLKDLAKDVSNHTGQTIVFLSLASEARLGVVGTIPRRYREGTTWFDNRSQSVLIEIGGDGIKGGYQQLRQPLAGNPYYDFVTIGIPKGVTTFSNEINRAAGEDADFGKFARSASASSERSIKTALRKELKAKPGLAHRKKVYLNGAIVWAMMTLLRPEDRQSFIPITVNDINLFYQRSVNAPQMLLNPDLSRIRDDETRREAGRDLEVVRSVFTPKSLIAGAEILKAVASEYNFQGEGKTILFARFSRLSLILSYVRLQAENGPRS